MVKSAENGTAKNTASRFNSVHIRGTLVPVEEPSKASNAVFSDFYSKVFLLLSNDWRRHDLDD